MRILIAICLYLCAAPSAFAEAKDGKPVEQAVVAEFDGAMAEALRALEKGEKLGAPSRDRLRRAFAALLDRAPAAWKEECRKASPPPDAQAPKDMVQALDRLCAAKAYEQLEPALVELGRVLRDPKNAPWLNAQLAGARRKIAGIEVRTIATSIEQYRLDRGTLPERLSDLTPQYLKELKNDPWGRAYLLELSPGRYRVVSAGPDGQLHTADDVFVGD